MDWIDSGFITGAADESAGSNRPQKPVWTVTALNTYVSGLLDKDVRLRSIDVSGEISGFKCYNKSGHLYFSVKDESSAVPCVMFRSSAERLRFAPKTACRLFCTAVRHFIRETENFSFMLRQCMKREKASCFGVFWS